MKRLWTALLLLAVLLGGSLSSAIRLEQFAAGLDTGLRQTDVLALSGDPEAIPALRRLLADWEAQSAWLHVTLRHGDIDEIRSGLEEALRLLELGRKEDCSAASARIRCQLRLLARMEQLRWENLF